MRTLLILSFLAIQATFSILGAQSFTQKLTTPTKGTVTLHQDQRLTKIVDGTNYTSVTGDDGQPLVKTGKKTKVRGYRIQVFFGDSSKADRDKAKKVGNAVTNAFSELEAYVDYESPHYRCRVGDFATREEAKEYLEKIKEAGLGKDAMIIRSEIFVYLPE